MFLFFILLQNIIYADKLENITQNNKLKVCIWSEYFGISYLDPRTQKLIGIDSDLALELAKDLQVELEYIPSSFPTFIEDLAQNRCDIAMFAIGNTSERIKYVRFTTPHLSSDIYAITTKTNKKINKWDDIDKKGVVVAVGKGTYHEPVMKEKLKYATLLVAKDFHTRSQEVISGRADVFMTDYPYVTRMLAKTDWAKLISPTTEYYKSTYAWAMSYGDDRFYNRVEEFLKDIKKDGRLLQLAKKNALEAIVKLD
jgi:ABC-type amino acid transport substrate-binding protein